jgi:hypothetical protein
MAVLAAAAVARGVLGVVVVLVVVAVVVVGALRFLAALLRTGVAGVEVVASPPPPLVRPRVAGSRRRSFLL